MSSSGSDGKDQTAKQKLTNILMNDAPAGPVTDLKDEPEDLEQIAQQVMEGMCIECGDQPATLYCHECNDQFDEVCFLAQHKRGNRAKHHTEKIKPNPALNPLLNAQHGAPIQTDGVQSQAQLDATAQATESKVENHGAGGTDQDVTAGKAKPAEKEKEKESKKKKDDGFGFFGFFGKGKGKEAQEESTDEYDQKQVTSTHGDQETPLTGTWFVERAKYIPLRLTLKQRKYLRLLEAALNVSEYTDKVDVVSYKDKTKRIYAQLKEVCAILSGLVVATDYKEGQQLIEDKEFKENAGFFQNLFELGRRHKIRNPEKMREGYGKLMYMLMDSVDPDVSELLGFHLVRPIRTVHSLLSEKNALAVLEDELMAVATSEIISDGRSRPEIDRASKAKERAIETLSRKYANENIGYDELRMCIMSINDNHHYLRFNRNPVDKMIEFLTSLFRADEIQQPYSLAIVGGRNGARLTHSHSAQYQYVLQSLTLWREIAHDMFRLWYLAEQDMLDANNLYRLRNTGQGLNRVQACPRIGRAMHNILHQAQRKVGSWVGSSVIHLGDHNVPNALMFIDKYNQVSRILNPIVICLTSLEKLYAKPTLAKFIDDCYGGVDKIRMAVLTDFFRHAFDGSGADNFFDAGSCIDGRLTSAWNWCQLLDKKPYYPLFQLSGFVGFDGQW